MSKQETILVVEDADFMRRELCRQLDFLKYNVITAENGEVAKDILSKELPDLILLDLNLPFISGFELLEWLRGFSNVPVIVITVNEQEKDIIRAMNLGANEYMVKPPDMDHLQKRVKSVLSFSIPPAGESIYCNGDLCIDFDKRRITFRGERLLLTPKAYSLLYVLASDTGQKVSHERLIQEVWGIDALDEGLPLLEAAIVSLRSKIEPDPSDPRYIVTEPSEGYSLRDQA